MTGSKLEQTENLTVWQLGNKWTIMNKYGYIEKNSCAKHHIYIMVMALELKEHWQKQQEKIETQKRTIKELYSCWCSFTFLHFISWWNKINWIKTTVSSVRLIFIPTNHLHLPTSSDRDAGNESYCGCEDFYTNLGHLYICLLSLFVNFSCFLHHTIGYLSAPCLISRGLCNLHNTALMLAMLLSLVLAPVRMGSQYSVQKLLRNRLSPSLLRRDFCGVN